MNRFTARWTRACVILGLFVSISCRESEPPPRYNRNLGEGDLYLLPLPASEVGPPLPSYGRVELPDRSEAAEFTRPAPPQPSAASAEGAPAGSEGGSLTGSLLDFLKGRKGGAASEAPTPEPEEP